MAEDEAKSGLWVAMLLDGHGGGRELRWEEVSAWAPEQGALWVHLDARHAASRRWLETGSGLNEAPCRMLLLEADRPRLLAFDDSSDAFLISLRGLAPELDDETNELALIHAYLEPRRMISIARRVLPNVGVMRELFRQGKGPKDIPQQLVQMAARLSASLHDEAINLEEPMAKLEYLVDAEHQYPMSELRDLERRVSRMRQHVAPFKILLSRMLSNSDAWLVSAHLAEWTRLSDETQDSDNLLQALRERVAALRGTVRERLARRSNEVLYVLTLLSAVMLPLTFLTGLFGMNVGIRGASYRWLESPTSFFVICAVLGMVALLGFLAIKRRNLL